MWTKAFWMDATERMVKTAAQAVLVSIGAVNVANGDVSWSSTLAGLGIGVALSAIFSLASTLVGNRNSASVLPEVGPPTA